MSSVGISKDSVNSSSGAAKPSNWNLPNVLTSLRILFIPVFVWLVLAEHQWWAFGLFAVLMATDKLDGDIARARGLITDFGKIADPIADKALMTAALVSLNIIGVLPIWITLVILVREFGITLWRMWMLRNGKDRKSTRLNSSHVAISYAVFCLKKKKRILCYIHPNV